MPKIKEEIFWVLKRETYSEMTFLYLNGSDFIPAYDFYNPIVLYPSYFLRKDGKNLDYMTFVLSDTLVRIVEIYHHETLLDKVMETVEAYAKKRMFFTNRLRCFYEATNGVTECFKNDGSMFLKIEDSKEHPSFYKITMIKENIEEKLCYAFAILHAYAIFKKDYTYSQKGEGEDEKGIVYKPCKK